MFAGTNKSGCRFAELLELLRDAGVTAAAAVTAAAVAALKLVAAAVLLTSGAARLTVAAAPVMVAEYHGTRTWAGGSMSVLKPGHPVIVSGLDCSNPEIAGIDAARRHHLVVDLLGRLVKLLDPSPRSWKSRRPSECSTSALSASGLTLGLSAMMTAIPNIVRCWPWPNPHPRPK